MATQAPSALAGAGYVTTEFPVPGLSRAMRHITGHDAEGKSIFLQTDCGDHHRILGEKQAIGNIVYSTNSNPVEINGDVDIKYAKENEVPLPLNSSEKSRKRKKKKLILPPAARSPRPQRLRCAPHRFRARRRKPYAPRRVARLRCRY